MDLDPSAALSCNDRSGTDAFEGITHCMTTETDRPFYASQNTGIGTVVPADDLLHPKLNSEVEADTATETQYFGFGVPGQQIHGMGYLWHHPNLQVVSGGVFVWKGHSRYMPDAEICDYRAFMRDTALAGDLHDYRLDNGYGVRVVEPLQTLHMSYEDTTRNNSVALDFNAIAPPVMYGDGRHFEQPMRVSGDLVLAGRHYDVNCYTIRDRSWGRSRTEDHMSLPPITWTTGIFGDDFGFNCTVFDQAENNAQAAAAPTMPKENTVSGGWILRDGAVSRVVEVDKKIRRDPQTGLPLEIDLRLTPEEGQPIEVHGTLEATFPWSCWPNMMLLLGQMRYECEGRVAYGDIQDGYWHDYLRSVQASRP
jgi:hypothetical protein